MADNLSPAKTGEKQGRDRQGRFRRGTSGNLVGRPVGTRNRATLLAESLLIDEEEALVRKAIELALGGNVVALKMCLERLIPPVRERPLHFDLNLRRPVDAKTAMEGLVDAIGGGQLTASELAALCSFVAVYTERWKDWERASHAEKFDIRFPGLAP